MNYTKLNNLFGWFAFVVAAFVYLSTMEDTTSLWDCGEYITTAYKLEVGHPPGAPLFNMVGRLFGAFVSKESAAVAINSLSALCSAFSIAFLFWTITRFARRFVVKPLSIEQSLKTDKGQAIAILGSGLVGAFAYMFTDSFWFSAAEGEVYAMSSFFTAVSFWAILKWEEVADEDGADRWLVLIAYLIGLSIGVHLLNLLAIPAITFVYYFKRFKKQNLQNFIITGIVSLIIVVFIQEIIIPKSISMASAIELSFKNNLGLPFNYGTVFALILLITLVTAGLYYTRLKSWFNFNTAIWSVVMILFGYSCFAMIVIRSNANTPIDENNPENLVSLHSYLKREQYGDWPILKGQQFNSQAIDSKNGSPVHIRAFVVQRGDKDVKGFKTEALAQAYISKNNLKGVEINEKYFVSDKREGTKYVYQENTVFPRMWSSQPHHIRGYKFWSDYEGDKNKPVARLKNQYDQLAQAIKQADKQGNTQLVEQYKYALRDIIDKGLYEPTFGENMRYFTSYQVGYMYLRYFLWNFAGKQNDDQAHNANLMDGNWLSGYDFIDNERLTSQEDLPEYWRDIASHNTYFYLPLILGLLGLCFHYFKDKEGAWIVTLLFILTGFAILIYVNQRPMEPRERDYAYAASFYAFAIWIGLGVYALYDLARVLKWRNIGHIALGTVVAASLFWLAEKIGTGEHAISYSIGVIGAIATAAIALNKVVFDKSKNSLVTAALPVLMTLIVPINLGIQNWDDHDRSGRYSARDMAMAYLDACEPNAILFTHGDNDTFPLWYVQEVEEYRTDVRIVNLSLLGTDWYIDQMKHKAYDSEGVPFSFTEEEMRVGSGLDLVQLDYGKRNPNQKALDVRKAIDYIKRKRNNANGARFVTVPTKKFTLPIDKNDPNVLAQVPEKFKGQIVDKMEWEVGKSLIYKHEIMILDLIAQNNWERPIYFASSASRSAYIGLDKFFLMEGLVYKLAPVAQGSKTSFYSGKVNSDRMYRNFVEKFRWGNLNGEGVYVCNFNRRHTVNYRIQFSQLAETLMEEGDQAVLKAMQLKAHNVQLDSVLATASDDLIAELENQISNNNATINALAGEKAKRYEMAKAALDKCVEVLPHENVPFDRSMAYIATAYYKWGAYSNDFTPAVNLTTKLVDIFEERFDYFMAQDINKTIRVNEDILESYNVLGILVDISTRSYPQPDIKDRMTNVIQNMQSKLLNYTNTVEISNPKAFQSVVMPAWGRYLR